MTNQLVQSELHSRKHGKTETISEQIKIFLEGGGKIQKIPSGVSGQSNLTYKRLMTISEKKAESD